VLSPVTVWLRLGRLLLVAGAILRPSGGRWFQCVDRVWK
jgi:hypothetical protein